MNIVMLGPAHPLRGGIAAFNERLATAFQEQGHTVTLYSFSLQYPSFLFPGTSQYTTSPAPAHLKILSAVNSINPFNWLKIGREIANLRPDLLIVRYWLPFMAPALGSILRRVRRNRYTRIICIADNIVPHEHRWGDALLTRYFIQPVDAFITMSEKVMHDLRSFTPKPAQLVPHPLYDHFGTPVPKAAAREKLNLAQDAFIFLFFGFIRKYKGLDLLLQAMQLLKQKSNHSCKLLVAGEFYEDRRMYDELIAALDIADSVLLHTHFIPDDEVKYYLCAADAVVQPYRSATQSGVTPLAYHFEVPMVVTNVGGLPDFVPHGKSGLVCAPQPADIAHAMETMMQLGSDYFKDALRTEKQKYSWTNLTKAILQLAAA